MNKRQIRTSINIGMVFVATEIPLPHGERYLVEDLLEIIKRLESDKKLVEIPSMGELHASIELQNEKLILSWVLVPDQQSRICDKPDVGFDESIIMDIQEKISAATEIALNSIDAGNQIAIESATRKITASEVLKKIRSVKEPKIAENVAARASGPQTDLFFTNESREIGGVSDAQKQFSDTDSFRIENCHVLSWAGHKKVMLQYPEQAVSPSIQAFSDKSNRIVVRIGESSPDSKIAKLALFSESPVTIEVSIGYDLKSHKRSLHVVRVLNDQEVISRAMSIIGQLQNSL